MSCDRKNVTNVENRFVTKKTGTYLIWYDPVFGRQRRVNLSKMNNTQYFQSIFGLQR